MNTSPSKTRKSDQSNSKPMKLKKTGKTPVTKSTKGSQAGGHKKKSKQSKKSEKQSVAAVDKPSTPLRVRLAERRSIDSLKPHPLQDQLFDDLPPVEFERLKQCLKEDGRSMFLDITEDGTILDGHQRAAALRELGETEVNCRVHHEFSSPTDESAVMFMVTRNVVRRHMDALGEARCFRKLKELRSGKRDGSGDTRDVVATGFRHSGKHLERVAKLLDLPRPLQQAYSRGELKQVTATRLLELDADLRRQLAEEVQQGRPAEKIAKGYLAEHAKGSTEPRPPALAPIKRLDKLRSEIGDDAFAGMTEKHLGPVQSVYGFLGEWLDTMEPAAESEADTPTEAGEYEDRDDDPDLDEDDGYAGDEDPDEEAAGDEWYEDSEADLDELEATDEELTKIEARHA